MSRRRASRRAARVRWREQAARLVARAHVKSDANGAWAWAVGNCTGVSHPVPGEGHPMERAISHALAFISDGFDVHVVRAYCERLVAEGERLAAERDVFTDWTRARGKGPETFTMLARCDACDGEGGGLADRPGYESWSCDKCDATGRRVDQGGWPGRLAREYGWERCEACEGRRASIVSPQGGRGYMVLEWCKPCRGRGRTRKPGVPPGFANGDSIARTARRLLATLDGRCPWAPSAKPQMSRCWRCAGSGEVGPIAYGPFEADGRAEFIMRSPPCPGCRGTGHNLAGVLPEVEHPAPRVVRESLTRSLEPQLGGGLRAGSSSEMEAWYATVDEQRARWFGRG
jgi:hypothetical protein